MIGKTNAISGVSAPVPKIRTVSGSVISIYDALAMPAVSLVADINAVQSGSGDPSPDNVRPITGWTEAKVWRTGKNLYLIDATHTGKPSEYVGNWESVTIVGNGNGFTARKKAADGGFGGIWAFVKAGTYTISCDVDLTNATGSAGNIKWAQVGASTNTTLMNITSNTETHREFTVTAPSDGILMFRPCASNWETNATHEITFTNVQLELGSTATAYEAYDGDTYTIDLDGTRYGGSLNVATGVLTVDKGYILLAGGNEATYVKNGATANTSRGIVAIPNKANGVSNIVSNRFSATISGDTVGRMYGRASNNSVEFYLPVSVPQTDADVKSWFSSNNTQLVYELATPLTIQLTATEIQLLLGNNTIWSDSGDSELQYWARR